jgi:hypothetical protein
MKKLLATFDSARHGNSESCEQEAQDDSKLNELKAQSSALELLLEKLGQKFDKIKEWQTIHAEQIQQINNLEAVNRNKSAAIKGQSELDPFLDRVTQGAYNTIFYRRFDAHFKREPGTAAQQESSLKKSY